MRIATISAAAATLLISMSAAFALDSNVTVTSSMSPDALWKKVGGFCGIGDWHPAAERCVLSADGVNASGDLIARDDRKARQVRIEPEAAHNVGEIDAARLDPNAQLACSRMRVRHLLDEKNLGRASFRNPDLPHGLTHPWQDRPS